MANTTLNEQVLVPAFGDFLYNPADKRIYFSDERGNPVPVGGSTYERPLWTPPWYNFWSSPRYFNPIMYATPETASKIGMWAYTVTTDPIKVDLEEIWDTLGTITAPQRVLRVTNTVSGVSDTFNAGLIAFYLDKNGDAAERRSFRAELKLNGIIA